MQQYCYYVYIHLSHIYMWCFSVHSGNYSDLSSIPTNTASLLPPPPPPLLHPHGMCKRPTSTRERSAIISQKSTLVREIVLYKYDNNYWIFIWSYSMWATSNYSCLFIICCVKEQNKLFCIIISYVEIKLKWINIVFALKTRKVLLNILIKTYRQNDAYSWYKW